MRCAVHDYPQGHPQLCIALAHGRRAWQGSTTGACLLLDPVGELSDLVEGRALLGHLLADLAVGVHHRGVVPAAEEQMAEKRSTFNQRSEEHTSELQSRGHLVCR